MPRVSRGRLFAGIYWIRVWSVWDRSRRQGNSWANRRERVLSKSGEMFDGVYLVLLAITVRVAIVLGAAIAC